MSKSILATVLLPVLTLLATQVGLDSDENSPANPDDAAVTGQSRGEDAEPIAIIRELPPTEQSDSVFSDEYIPAPESASDTHDATGEFNPASADCPCDLSEPEKHRMPPVRPMTQLSVSVSTTAEGSGTFRSDNPCRGSFDVREGWPAWMNHPRPQVPMPKSLRHRSIGPCADSLESESYSQPPIGFQIETLAINRLGEKLILNIVYSDPNGKRFEFDAKGNLDQVCHELEFLPVPLRDYLVQRVSCRI